MNPLNRFNIYNSFVKMEQKKWPKLYWLIDVHNTIINGTYKKDMDNVKLYPYAGEVLRRLTDMDDMVLILWTSSYPEYVADFREWLDKEFSIRIDYFNENPECQNTETADLSKKFYYDILLDDKAGFDAEEDWWAVLNELLRVENHKSCGKLI